MTTLTLPSGRSLARALARGTLPRSLAVLFVIFFTVGGVTATPGVAAARATAADGCLVRPPTESEVARIREAAGVQGAVDAFAGSAPNRIALQYLILRRGDGTGGVTDDLFPEMLKDLNYGFRDAPFVYVPMPDIIYVDSDEYYTINTLQEAWNLMSEYETPGVVNIFFSDQLLFDEFQARAYTSPTNPRGHIFGDVVGLPYNPPFPPHELGHLFWLWHPYETQFGAECVDGSNCLTAGDLLCDTPASPSVHNGNTTATGVYFGNESDPCTGQPIYAPRTDLYMEAGWAPGHAGYMYRSAFSDDQVGRMIQILLNFSPDLITNLPDVLVDCDGDLNDDIEEILAGNEVDLNRDMVPDQCQVFANDGDLLVSNMSPNLTNRPRFFDGATGAYRGDLWSGAWWVHQFRRGPEGYIYMPSLSVIQRMSLDTGRLVDNFIDGYFEGAGTFVDLLWDDGGDLLVLDNVDLNIRRYGGTDGAYLGVFADLAPSGMTSPKYMEYGFDGNIYVVGNQALGNTIQMVHPTTGALLGSFITPGDGGLVAGQGLVFHSDGFLYVSNGGTQNNVLRYDGLTGTFDRKFVSNFSGGLSNPHSLRFGPEGNLYVASRNTDSVKRYDADGNYLGNFVEPGAGGPPGSGGVHQPAGILFIETGAASAGGAGARAGFALGPGVPNPFTGQTTLRFDLPRPLPVTLAIYDVRGALVRVLRDAAVTAPGRHAVVWDGRTSAGAPAPAGVYFYGLEAGGLRTSRRVVLVR